MALRCCRCRPLRRCRTCRWDWSLAVTAYQPATGLRNSINPTFAVVIGGLGHRAGALAERWLAFVWPLQAILDDLHHGRPRRRHPALNGESPCPNPPSVSIPNPAACAKDRLAAPASRIAARRQPRRAAVRRSRFLGQAGDQGPCRLYRPDARGRDRGAGTPTIFWPRRWTSRRAGPSCSTTASRDSPGARAWWSRCACGWRSPPAPIRRAGDRGPTVAIALRAGRAVRGLARQVRVHPPLLPNMIFTREQCLRPRRGTLNPMFWAARNRRCSPPRSTVDHPKFAGKVRELFGDPARDFAASLEGAAPATSCRWARIPSWSAWASGPRRKASGCSAQALLDRASRAVARRPPRTRSAMHLDTVFTFCGGDVVTTFKEVADGITRFDPRPGGPTSRSASREDRRPIFEVVAKSSASRN